MLFQSPESELYVIAETCFGKSRFSTIYEVWLNFQEFLNESSKHNIIDAFVVDLSSLKLNLFVDILFQV